MADGKLEVRLRRRQAEEAQEVLVRRVRVGFWINLLACTGFVVTDAIVEGTLSLEQLLVATAQVALLTGAMVRLRTEKGRDRVLWLAIVTVALVCAAGVKLAGERGDTVGYDMLLVAMTIGAAAFIPWSTRWQVALVVVAAGCTAAADYYAGAWGSEQILDPLFIGVSISYLSSIYIANVLQLERSAAQEQELRRLVATAELASSREQLRALSARLVSVQEEERTRIAREVHDELGQKLTALKFMASALGQRAKLDDELGKLRNEVVELIDSTLQAVQRIAKSLRPGVLDDLGFGAALTSLVNEFEDRTGIECELDFEESLVIDREGTTALYRIVQEALTNVARHASASHTWITVRVSGESVELRVADDGTGIEPDALEASTSLGILGMRERARACGGDVAVGRAEQGGALLEARILASRPSS